MCGHLMFPFIIISGNLKQGEKIPSVRDYASLFKVNPNTMQKALIELERDGLLYTDRTNGKYVTTNQKVITKFKKKVISTKINAFLKDMNDIGIDNKDIIDYLKERDKNGIN